MNHGMQRRYLTSGLVLLSLQSAAYSDDAARLTPFVGETTREFEARRRGVGKGATTGGRNLSVQADSSGHFFVEPTLDGRQVRMLVDTGASVVTLSYEDAQLLALSLGKRDFTQRVLTANGPVEAAPIRIGKVQIGDIVVESVEALVLPPGRLKTSLLGMTLLKRLNAFEISGGRLFLRQ